MSASRGSAEAPQARYFDGVSAEPRPASARLADGALRVVGRDGAVLAHWPSAKVAAIGSAGADGSVTLGCADSSGRLVLPDGALLAALPRPARRLPWRGLAFVAGAALVLGVVLADPSRLLPRPLEAAVGDYAFRALIGDAPVCTGSAGQGALDGLAARLADVAGVARPSVTVVRSPIANAFALPGARIVIFSALLDRTRDSAAFAGVLAHEIGHLLHDDPLRAMGRHWAVLVAGRLAGVSDLSAPAQIGLLAYDRAAESRADATAVDVLRRAGLRADGLSQFLSDMAEQDGGIAWLSNHPASRERSAATAASAEGDMPLDPESWHSVRAICERT